MVENKKLSDYFYENIDPRRRQEMKDARMVQEDRNAIANLSPKFIHREYNQNAFNQQPIADDEVGDRKMRREW